MNKENYKIGVFDSGLGGISVLKELVKVMPNEDYIYFGDSQFAPYGTKTKEEVLSRCIYICDFFANKGVKAIVIACNTATSAAVDKLRKKYTDIPIIGMEPALKVAAHDNHDNNIIVMATKLTLEEKKFRLLMDRYAEDNNIIKLPCPELVEIVEGDKLDNTDLVNEQLQKYFENIDMDNIHSIVLGCTHFVFFKNYIKSIVNDTTKVIDGNNGTARHLQDILRRNKTLSDNNDKGCVEFYNSIDVKSQIDLSKKLFEI